MLIKQWGLLWFCFYWILGFAWVFFGFVFLLVLFFCCVFWGGEGGWRGLGFFCSSY